MKKTFDIENEKITLSWAVAISVFIGAIGLGLGLDFIVNCSGNQIDKNNYSNNNIDELKENVILLGSGAVQSYLEKEHHNLIKEFDISFLACASDIGLKMLVGMGKNDISTGIQLISMNSTDKNIDVIIDSLVQKKLENNKKKLIYYKIANEKLEVILWPYKEFICANVDKDYLLPNEIIECLRKNIYYTTSENSGTKQEFEDFFKSNDKHFTWLQSNKREFNRSYDNVFNNTEKPIVILCSEYYTCKNIPADAKRFSVKLTEKSKLQTRPLTLLTVVSNNEDKESKSEYVIRGKKGKFLNRLNDSNANEFRIKDKNGSNILYVNVK